MVGAKQSVCADQERKRNSFSPIDEPLVTEANGSSNLNAKNCTIKVSSSHHREYYEIILFPTSPGHQPLMEDYTRAISAVCMPGE
jgi:hypothetical protein